MLTGLDIMSIKMENGNVSIKTEIPIQWLISSVVACAVAFGGLWYLVQDNRKDIDTNKLTADTEIKKLTSAMTDLTIALTENTAAKNAETREVERISKIQNGLISVTGENAKKLIKHEAEIDELKRVVLK